MPGKESEDSCGPGRSGGIPDSYATSGDGATAVTASGAGDMVTVIVATCSGSAATNMPS